MSSAPRSLPLVVLSIVAAVIVAFGGIVAGGKTWDDTAYHAHVAPPRLAAAAAIQRGAWPAWWDGTGLGVPLAAEPSHGALYPPVWIASSPRALDWLLLAHLAWAGIGVALWARRRSSELGAAVAGMLVATSGILVGSGLRGELFAVAHVGWLALAAERLRTADDRRTRSLAAAGVGIAIGAIALAGQLGLLIDALVIAIVLGRSRWLVASIAAGLAIGALQWLPAALALGDTAGAQVGGVPLAQLGDLVVPLWRSDAALPAIFIGGGLVGLAAIPRFARRDALLGLFAVAAFALPGGSIRIGTPALHLAMLAVLLGERAARGVDALLGDGASSDAASSGAASSGAAVSMRRARVVLAATIVATGVATLATSAAVVPALCSIACLAGALAIGRRRAAVTCALVVGASAGAMPSLAPLIDRDAALGPVVDRELVSAPPAWAELAEATRGTAPVRVFRPVYLYAHPSLADAIATFAGASAARWDIDQARSEDPARPEDHDRVWLAAAAEGGALLDRFGISLAVLPSTLLGARHLHSLGRRGSWALVALPVAPAAAVVDGWHRAVEPDDALALMFARGGGTGILRGSTVLRGGGTSRDSSAEPKACAIDAWRAGDIALTCTAERDGYAVISSSTARGWSVDVDDGDIDWITADVMRRAVAVPAGTHRVHWAYATPGGRLAALLALGGLGLLVALARRRV